MNIERYIQQITNDGKTLVDFLADNVQGNTQHATVSHRLRSVEWLAALGGFIPEDAIPKYASVRPRPKSEPQNGKRDKRDKKSKVTEKQILHFDIARLIKRQTQDGKTAIDFLARVVTKGERPKSGENFTVAARMRATRELLIRGFGNSAACNRRILSGDTEELGSDLAKRIRGCTNDGAELVHILINALENKTPEATSKGAETPYPKFERQRKTKPAEGFTPSQRVWAACELLRRAYDIRTDHITHEDIQAYWNAQPPADPRTGADNPDIDRTGITPKDVQAEAAAIARASKAGANANNRDKSENRPAAVNEKRDDDAKKPAAGPAGEQPAAAKQPAVASNIAAAEKSDEKRNAAYNTPSANPGNPGRAARRRQQRAARKAQKRKAAANNNGSAKTHAANRKNGKPRAIHSTDIDENTVVFSHEPLSIEEWKRLRKTLARPDNIPANARSP